jgi:uncharacterized protein (DUF433 family)
MIVVTPGFFGIQACIDGVKIAVQAGLRRALVHRHWMTI